MQQILPIACGLLPSCRAFNIFHAKNCIIMTAVYYHVELWRHLAWYEHYNEHDDYVYYTHNNDYLGVNTLYFLTEYV